MRTGTGLSARRSPTLGAGRLCTMKVPVHANIFLSRDRILLVRQTAAFKEEERNLAQQESRSDLCKIVNDKDVNL